MDNNRSKETNKRNNVNMTNFKTNEIVNIITKYYTMHII